MGGFRAGGLSMGGLSTLQLAAHVPAAAVLTVRGELRPSPAYGRGSRTTVRKKSSICRTAAMNWLTSTGLVTNALACSL
jgi:hypothetical protein